MFEHLVLGIVQGLGEWLPVSSEGLVILVKNNFFAGGDLIDMVKLALFLHLGTFIAALVYLWKDVVRLTKAFFKPKDATDSDKAVVKFLIITTIISGLFGIAVLNSLEAYGEGAISGTFLNILIAIMLLITGLLQLRAKKKNQDGLEFREAGDVKTKDSLILGVAQGFSPLPGLSRSGVTIAFLLLQRFKEEDALRLSFLMSLPLVLIGNIVLGLSNFSLSPSLFAGLFAAFIFGLATIHLFMKIAKKVNFGWFVIGFAVITALATLVH